MDKKALNFRGHVVYSLTLLLFGIFLYSEFIGEFPLWSLIKYLPFYLMGAVFVDKIEIPNSPFHRAKLHSKKFFWITLLLIIPMTILFGYFKSANWYFLTSFFVGHLSHLAGDWLTRSGLP